MKYSTTILAAANIVALAQAAPVESVCSQVVVTYTGAAVWVPNPDPSWLAWYTTSTKTSAKPTSTDAVWPAWTSSSTKGPAVTSKTSADPWNGWYTTTTTSKSVAPTSKTSYDPWNGWYTSSTTTSKPVAPTSKTSYDPWNGWNPTTSSTKAAAPTTTASSTPTPSPSAPSCPASNGASVFGGGDCECVFQVNCGAHAGYTADTKFWEKDSGAIVHSLAECLSICDNNADCTAAIWVDDSSAPDVDYHRCWQTSNLGAVYEAGYGQISYKQSCSGHCSGYTNA